MLKASNISLYKLMTAGYISAETYAALQPKTQYCQLGLADCESIDSMVGREVSRLFYNSSVKKSIAGLEQMEMSLSMRDRLPYDLLNKLLEQPGFEPVASLLTIIGAKLFLLDYVFCCKDRIAERAFITPTNINRIIYFINLYEDAFCQLYSDPESSLSTIFINQKKEEVAVAVDDAACEAESIMEEVAESEERVVCEPETVLEAEAVPEEGVAAIAEHDEFANRKTVVKISHDAIADCNIRYKDCVEKLSKLNSIEFKPFSLYLKSKLKELPIGIRMAIGLLLYQNFYVNYLFADDRKWYSIPRLGKTSVLKLLTIKGDLIDYVVRSFNVNESGEQRVVCEPETVLEAVPEEGVASIVEHDDFANRKTVVKISYDAIADCNIRYKDCVEKLSKLNSTEFQPFSLYLNDLLKTLPIRVQNCLDLLDCQYFYVNYLFAEERKWLSIPGFGRKSICDLSEIKDDLISHVVRSLNVNVEQKPLPVKKTLKEIIGDFKYALLQSTLQDMMGGLSVRAGNGIHNYEGDFIEDFVHLGKDLRNLRNIGRKTEGELLAIVGDLKLKVADLIEQELEPGFELKIKNQMRYGEILWDDYAQAFFEAHGHAPMLHLLENLMNYYIGNDRDWSILNAHIPMFEGVEMKSREEIAETEHVSRERCRQICKNCIDSINEVCSGESSGKLAAFSNLMSLKEDWAYITEGLEQRDFIEPSELSSYIKDEGCKLSEGFVFQILGRLMGDQYTCLGIQPYSLPTREKQVWEGSYLVKSEYAAVFNFEEFPNLIEEVERDLTENVDVTADDLVLSHLILAWNEFDPEKTSVVANIVSNLLIFEFGKFPNEFMQFTLEANKQANVTEIIYNMLSENGKPMSTTEIYARLQETVAYSYKSEKSVKMLIAKDPRICWVGVDNLISLSEWDHIKVGSIRDIIVEFLASFDEPQCLDAVVNYVHKYRKNTSRNSIRTTMGNGDQFIVFEDGFYGLKDKTYDLSYIEQQKRCTFAERVKDFESFLQKHHHFPIAQSDLDEERSLYRWWRFVQNEAHVSEELQHLVERIQEQYKDYPNTKREVEWMSRCDEYEAFLKKHGRKPSMRDYKQVGLYRWWCKCESDFAEGRMSALQEKLYIELCNLL